MSTTEESQNPPQVAEDPIKELSSINEKQNISQFNLSDGPLSVSLSVYVSNWSKTFVYN